MRQFLPFFIGFSLLFLLACSLTTPEVKSPESSVNQTTSNLPSKETQFIVSGTTVPTDLTVIPEKLTNPPKTDSPEPTLEATSTAIPEPTATATPEPTSTAIPEPTATATPGPTSTAIPELTATATPEPTSTAIPEPTATATPEPTATTVPVPTATVAPQKYVASEDLNVLSQFGFSISLEEDVNFSQFGVQVSGVSLNHADGQQGLLTFDYNGVDVAVIWLPNEGQSAEDVIGGAYFLLQSAQPNNSFTVINSGAVMVAQTEGYFSGFLMTDMNGDGLGGGLIGSWNCDKTDFTIIVTGDDPTVLQIRFDRLLSGFACTEKA